MQKSGSLGFVGGKMRLVCMLLAQLAACGGSGYFVALAEAAESATTASAKTGLAPTVADASKAAPTPSTSTLSASAPTLSSTDSRVVYWIDPRLSFGDLRPWGPSTQIYGNNRSLADVAEPGIIGSGTDYALSRVTDPLDSSKAAFRHRIAGAFPTWGSVGARRSEITANWSNDGTNVMRGTDYWVAFAVKFAPDMFGSGNGGASLLEFHQVPDQGENWLPSSFNMYAGENSISFSVRWDTAQPSIGKSPAQKTLWSESAPSTTQWHWIVMKVRLHWDVAQSPYLKIWRAVGDAPLQQLVDYKGPNDYNNVAPYVPQKFGVYRWDSWSGKPTRTLYTKGLYVVKAETGSPAIDEQSLLNLLKQI